MNKESKELLEKLGGTLFSKILILGPLVNVRSAACLYEGHNDLKNLILYPEGLFGLDFLKKEAGSSSCLLLVEGLFYKNNPISQFDLPENWKIEIVSSSFFKQGRTKMEGKSAAQFLRTLLLKKNEN